MQAAEQSAQAEGLYYKSFVSLHAATILPYAWSEFPTCHDCFQAGVYCQGPECPLESGHGRLEGRSTCDLEIPVCGYAALCHHGRWQDCPPYSTNNA